jgi:2-keto-3-deoxy-6-phosphogluconate aldolase
MWFWRSLKIVLNTTLTFSLFIVATLIMDDPNKAVELAHSLLAGEIDVMELTLRTPGAYDALRC